MRLTGRARKRTLMRLHQEEMPLLTDHMVPLPMARLLLGQGKVGVILHNSITDIED